MPRDWLSIDMDHTLSLEYPPWDPHAGPVARGNGRGRRGIFPNEVPESQLERPK